MIEFNAVLPELLVGSCPVTAVDVERLRRGPGVTALLSLQTDADVKHHGIDPRLEQACRDAGMTHLRIPIREFDDDDLIRRLRPAARCVDELLRVGHRLYLHCNAGLERSPSVAVAYLVWYRNLALGEALAAVSAGRPCRPREWALKRVLGGGG